MNKYVEEKKVLKAEKYIAGVDEDEKISKSKGQNFELVNELGVEKTKNTVNTLRKIRNKNEKEKSFLNNKTKSNVDVFLAVATVVLATLGLLFIYSASSYSAEIQFSDKFHYVKTQAVALVLGTFFMIAVSYLDLSKVKKLALPIYIISLVLLALVFIPGFGIEIYGAKRWINLGFFTLQPSEYAKFGMIIFISAIMVKYGVNRISTLCLALLAGGAVCALLVIEPNMSITICCALVIFCLVFFGGAKIKHLLALFIPIVAGGIALVIAEPYRVKRLMAFADPWASPLEEGYQLIQSYYSLGSGGMFGIGLFNSRQKYLFLPFSESDFIFSIIGEELGFVGCLIVISLFLFIIVRGIIIAVRSYDRFSSYLAAGVTSMIAVQTVVNVAVVCGAIPPTGLPLPFISAGGSSLVAYMCAVGLLLSSSRYSARSLAESVQITKITHKKFPLHNM